MGELRSDYTPGDRDDFERLYRETYARIRATLIGILGDPAAAEDCVQEAFVRGLRGWARWRPDAPAEAWVHRIAVNVAITHRRRERLGATLHRLSGRPAPATDAGRLAERGDIVDALAALPPKQAAVIVLRHLHGYSNREIAASVGVPERTVASRLASAREALRARLGPAWEGEIGYSADLGGSFL